MEVAPHVLPAEEEQLVVAAGVAEGEGEEFLLLVGHHGHRAVTGRPLRAAQEDDRVVEPDVADLRPLDGPPLGGGRDDEGDDRRALAGEFGEQAADLVAR
ncbi:MAG: hypothetical protein Q8S73_23385 [Deltaproteobacteria bacterium]|nr:hypothetical protein [Myxococcales bacterium]MDP3217074.1 hypothetical protein [Deltaproteobacteria bacterium]